MSARRSWARTGVLRGLAAREIARDIECGRINGSVRYHVGAEMYDRYERAMRGSDSRRWRRKRRNRLARNLIEGWRS